MVRKHDIVLISVMLQKHLGHLIRMVAYVTLHRYLSLITIPRFLTYVQLKLKKFHHPNVMKPVCGNPILLPSIVGHGQSANNSAGI